MRWPILDKNALVNIAAPASTDDSSPVVDDAGAVVVAVTVVLGGRDVEEAAPDDVGELVSDVEAPVVDMVMTVVVGLPDIGGTPCEKISS